MKILILGGTRFLGRHLAQQALQAGHELSLLHRGRSGAGLFPPARHFIGDRDTDLHALLAANEHWDAVIDTSAYFPRQVQQAAAVLAGRVGQYQLVSSISVYAEPGAQGTDEAAPLLQLDDGPLHTSVTGANYGGLKAQCEAVAQQGFGARCLVVRPGLLVGPHDPTGRFTWWAQRYQRARADETVLAPGDPQGPVQFIDVRDAAAWMLLQAQRGGSGVVNLTGPDAPARMGELMDLARQTLAPQSRLHWLPEAFLLEQGVTPWTDLPLWLPAAQAGLHRMDITRALATGLQCRPWADTLRDTADWASGCPVQGGPKEPGRPQVGLSAEREAALLSAWAAR